MSDNAGTPMPENLEPLEWAKEGVRRLEAEIECVRVHLDVGERGDDDNDYVAAMLHLSSIVEGIGAITRTMMQDVMTNVENAMVAALLFQKKHGVAMSVVVDEENGYVGLEVEAVEVPDDLSGLEGEGDEW